MISEDIKSLLKSLEGLMYGKNYQVVFRLDYYEYCTTFDDFKRQFKQIYSGANMEETSLSLVSSEEFWNDINEGLDYRGDDGAGLHLSDTREKELKEIQKRYKDCIALFMNKKKRSYSDIIIMMRGCLDILYFGDTSLCFRQITLNIYLFTGVLLTNNYKCLFDLAACVDGIISQYYFSFISYSGSKYR
jgi:hypothetical protein